MSKELVAALLLVAGCRHVYGIEVHNHPAALATQAQWVEEGWGEGCGELPPFHLVTSQELRHQCHPASTTACHTGGDIFVHVDIPNTPRYNEVVAHEYLHYMLWCNGKDTDSGHTRAELWCGDSVECFVGRVLQGL